MHLFLRTALGLAALPLALLSSAAGAAGAVQPVTAENFARAESDYYFSERVKPVGIGKLWNRRDLASIDKQVVIRINRDTLYSSGVFDLDAGPVTLTLPDAGKRYMSLQVVNQDHYTQAVHHGAGPHTLTRESVGTRYAYVLIRTFVDPNSADDLKQARALQDAIQVGQKAPGQFEVPAWDPEGRKRMRDALLVLASTVPDANRTFGPKGQVDPLRHLLGTASGWGGLPETEAVYLSGYPRQADGKTVHRLTVKEVPVDGFWSLSVYNAQGFFEKNAEGVYTLNNVTAQRGSDGSVTIQFGGCEGGKTPNCMPITPGWNYTVRLYQPRKEAISGTWKFPEAQPVQ